MGDNNNEYVLIHSQLVEVFSSDRLSIYEQSFDYISDKPIRIKYLIKNNRVESLISDYFIQDGINNFTELSVENDDNIKIELTYSDNGKWCMENIYYKIKSSLTK